MSHQGVLSTKQQEAAFLKILKKPCNLRCADCSSKSPTWASLDFGVFICYNCSGQHRALGQNITKVRSTKLDCWTQENLDMMDTLGNDLNDYWENRLPKNAKLQPSATPEEIKNYVQEKYIKRTWVKQGQADPKTRYTQCLMSGVPFRVNQTNTFFSENGTQNQVLKDQMKQFHSTQQVERKERQFSIDSKQKEINLLSPDKGGEFDWSSFNHFHTVSGVPHKQLEIQQKKTQQPPQQPANQPSPTFKPKQNNLNDFDLLSFCHQQQQQQQQTNQQSNIQQFYSYNPPSSNQFNTVQPQSWAKQQNTTVNNTEQQQKVQQQQQPTHTPTQSTPVQTQQQTNPIQNQQQPTPSYQQPTPVQNYQQPTPVQQQPFQYQTYQTQQTNQMNQAFNNQPQQYQAPYQQPQQYQQFQTVNQQKPPQNGNDLFGFSSQQCWTSKPPLPNKPNTNNNNNNNYSNNNNNNNNNNQQWAQQQFSGQKYQNNPFVKDCQDIMNLYNTQQPNKYEQLRNNPFM